MRKPKTSNQRQVKSRKAFNRNFGQNKWVAENNLTLLTANNNRTEWTPKDDKFVMIEGISLIKKAVLLGRTKNAVSHRIKLLNAS